jgi:hypothetical protein
MSDPLESVLKLVAEGRLTAEEAGPILAALQQKPKAPPAPPNAPGFPGAPGHPFGPGSAPPGFAADDNGASQGEPGRAPRWARVEVRERGKRVVDLRVPISLGRFALGRIPGLSKEQITEVEEAVGTGTHGPILDVEDANGDGVRIVLE